MRGGVADAIASSFLILPLRASQEKKCSMIDTPQSYLIGMFASVAFTILATLIAKGIPAVRPMRLVVSAGIILSWHRKGF